MLIKPFKPDIDYDNDECVLKFNTSKGSLNNVRSSLYVKMISGTDGYIGHEVYDVILVSDMIKHYKTHIDWMKDFNLTLENFELNSLLRSIDGNGMNVFGKIVHVFNGVYKGDPSANIKDKLANMILYPSISYSIGSDDGSIMPISKVLYIKHGSRTLSNVVYYHKQHILNYMDNEVPDISVNKADINALLDKITSQGAYIDITDPRYPDIHPYRNGQEYPRCLEIKLSYTGNELISALTNLSAYFVNSEDSLRLEEQESELRNMNLRRAMMSMDIDSNEYERTSRIIEMRMMARNIAVDYTKVSVCSMLENAKIIYDSLDPNKVPQIIGIRIPFDKYPSILMRKMILALMSEYNSIIGDVIKTNARNLNIMPKHYRISLNDTPYDILVKITDFDHQISESIRMNKSEALHDYLIEGIHKSNENKMVIHRNTALLMSKPGEN